MISKLNKIRVHQYDKSHLDPTKKTLRHHFKLENGVHAIHFNYRLTDSGYIYTDFYVLGW